MEGDGVGCGRAVGWWWWTGRRKWRGGGRRRSSRRSWRWSASSRRRRRRGALSVLTANKSTAAKGSGGEAGRGCAPLQELAEDEARLEREIEGIMHQMRAPDVSAAKQFALKKTLAVCRAQLLKLNRKSEAARAEAVRAPALFCARVMVSPSHVKGSLSVSA